MIEIGLPTDLAALDSAVISLSAGEYSWVGFASVNAVQAVVSRAKLLALTMAMPADTRVAAVGPATTKAIRAAGFPVDLTPDHAGSAAVLASIWPAARMGESVLLPQSEIAGTALAHGLIEKGFRVDAVTAYRTLPCDLPTSVVADLAEGSYEAVLLTSPSTVHSISHTPIAAGTVLGAIGSSTAAAAAVAGLTISFTATDPTDCALIAGLAAFAQHHPRRKP